MSDDEPGAGGAARRIAPLDGLRGIAVLAVMGYHYFARWTPLHDDGGATTYPYGDLLARFPPFTYGLYGVQLFFVLSGLVIHMTLDASARPTDFAVRRFARIYPPLLLCSVVTFAILAASHQGLFDRSAIDLVPSTTLIPDRAWTAMLHRHVGLVDGAYWSLFVEVQFYVLAAVIYFAVPGARRLFVVAAMIAFAPLMALAVLNIGNTMPLLANLPWFLLGLAFYHLYRGRDRLVGLAAIAECMVVILVPAVRHGRVEVVVVTALIVTPFVAFVYRPALLHWAGARWLTRIGLASYVLYLLHQDLGVLAIHAIGRALGLDGTAASLVIGFSVWLAVLALGHVLHHRVEEPVRRAVVRALTRRAR